MQPTEKTTIVGLTVPACGAGELPAQVEGEFPAGVQTVMRVEWEPFNSKLVENPERLTVQGTATEVRYPEPWILNRADPYVLKHTDGFYYFTGSVPEYDRIVLRKSATLGGLADAPEAVIWTKYETGPMGNHIWAPELHVIGGKWYIYFAAGTAEDRWAIRPYVLECADADPTTGTWVEKGQIVLGFESFSLDATTFELHGERYLVWAQYEDKDSNLYLAKLQNPWTLAEGEPTLIARPTLDWEIEGFRVNEGPAVLIRNGRIFVTFSASATDHRYCVGLLEASLEADLLDPASWHKHPKPVLTTNEDTLCYGPGHNCFTVSEDGTTDLLVFHARPYRDLIGSALSDPNRHARIQPISWLADGTPCLGTPGKAAVQLAVTGLITVME